MEECHLCHGEPNTLTASQGRFLAETPLHNWVCLLRDCWAALALNMAFCKNALVKRNPYVQLVSAFRRAAQSTRLIVAELLVALRFYRRSHTNLLAKDAALADEWPWVRMYVLRRDRYRCLACYTQGDEITLHVNVIRSLSLNVNGLITLCEPCHHAAQDLRIAGNNAPGFLHSLWRKLRLAYQPPFLESRLIWTSRDEERRSLVDAYAKRV
jgi:hypothetical protein